MSQSGGYQYQYIDPSSPLKNCPPPLFNGQPNATQHIQNGIPTSSYNPGGTPSTQSSRDPSREPSRDPSPIVHSFSSPGFNPNLGSISSSVNSKATEVSSQGQNYTLTQHSNFGTNVSTSNNPSQGLQPGQVPPTIVPTFSRSNQNPFQPLPTSNYQPPIFSQTVTRSNQLPPNQPLANQLPAKQPPIKQSPLNQPPLNQPPLNQPPLNQPPLNQPPLNQPPLNQPPLNQPPLNQPPLNQPPLNQPPLNQPPLNQPPLNQPPLKKTPLIQPPLNQPPQNQPPQNQPLLNQPPINQPPVNQPPVNQPPLNQPPLNQPPPNQPPPNQPPPNPSINQNINQSAKSPIQNLPFAGMNMSKTQTQMATSESQLTNFNSNQSGSVFSTPLKLGSQQTLFSNPLNSQNNLQQPIQNLSPFPNSPNTPQNMFAHPQQIQTPLQSQNLAIQRNSSISQNNYQPQSKPPSQYPPQPPMQQNIFGSYTESTATQGPSLQQSQSYNSQHNLASQRKYPQTPYDATLSSNTANIMNPMMPSQLPDMSPTTPNQYNTRPAATRMPPPPTRPQMQSHCDPRVQYPGQMSNIPLNNSMLKRYPGSYPDQMNQLNNQMSGMTVTQAGFNKLWGVESIDLLQCRNVLPQESVEPPKIKLQEFLDNINCSPDIFRCTLTKIPESNSLLQKSRLPLGVLIHPFKDINHLPVIQCSTIVRCRACRTYINPFVYFVDTKRWKCNLCYRVNELPDEFQFDPVTKSYGDPSRRPEVKTSTIEFIAPSEYMLRPPQPAVYLFILDVSRLAVESGYLTIVCNIITEELSRLPGDSRTQVGFLAVDSAVHFFSMPDNVSQPHEMIMLDVDDVFIPCPDNLIVNLKERDKLVKELLDQLPTKFEGTHDTNNALGAGLQAAYKLMSPTGGRITVFQTCLPNVGPGLLQAREDPNNRASKDVPHLNPATDFYKRLALDCSGQQIAVDLFLLNSQYSDLATLSGMCKFSGGCMYHLPLFRVNKLQPVETLERILRRYLTRKIGFEAVMRIRCTRGLSIHTFHGNFFVRSTDLLSLPNVNPDAGFGMQISIEENLSDIQNVCFQAALLYTSSRGERRIRVHTLCLPVASSLTDILHSADQQCIIGLLSKMAVDRSQQSSLSDARDALINVAIDVLSAYKLSQSVGSGGLLAPESLKLLPLYIIALLKCIAFRAGTSTRLDDRVFAMCQLKSLPLSQLIQMVYPDMYPIHVLDDVITKDVDGKICPQPPRLHLSAEKLDSRGAFLMDAGDKILIYIGKNIHPSFCCNVLGVASFSAIPEEFYDLPELDTTESERLRNFVFSIQEEKPFYATVQILRDDSHFRTIFTERLIEDRIESALSYYEFLQHLKTQVK
ncbi:protein transport protein Sec24A [Prorops nasuta]|uniref:protein transport protein Sec24A n=1 Tax=Prorops nasuta TaxID=863751 RepID=UPI0034CDF2AC